MFKICMLTISLQTLLVLLFTINAHPRNKSFETISLIGSALIYLKGPKFLIYVSGALSMWVRSRFHICHDDTQ